MRIPRKQTAVYWAPTGQDGYGEHTYAQPVELAVRWEERNELFINKEGREVRSEVVVYPIQALQNEGLLYLGLLSGLTDPQKANPRSIAGIHEIKAVQSLPNFKATQFIHRAWM
jgi:hypothetical protein